MKKTVPFSSDGESRGGVEQETGIRSYNLYYDSSHNCIDLKERIVSTEPTANSMRLEKKDETRRQEDRE